MPESSDLSPSAPSDETAPVEVQPGVVLNLKPSAQLAILRQQVTNVDGRIRELNTRLNGMDLNGHTELLKKMSQDWQVVGPVLVKMATAHQDSAIFWKSLQLRLARPFGRVSWIFHTFVGALLTGGAYWIVNHIKFPKFLP